MKLLFTIFLAALPAVAQESTGMVPLPDLGKGLYKGEQGGLYPGGQNVPPPAYEKAGLEIARTIVPLARDGKPRPEEDARIVMVSTGMSNTTMESQAFARALETTTGVNPRFQFVDCAQGAQVARVTANPGANYWKVAEERLLAAQVTLAQVQIAWIKQANPGPTKPFPEEVKALQSDLLSTLRNLHDKYPNLKLAYISSRIYGGYAQTPLNPEPHAYEGAFAVKWVIADAIAGKIAAPWIAWSPYLWADGVKGRKQDALIWTRADLAEDGTHPSPSGRNKVAKLLVDFLMSEPTARPWFRAN